MKNITNVTIRNIDFYNAMLKACAEGMTEFEYNDWNYVTDDALNDFVYDLKHGKLSVTAKKNI